MTDEGLAHERSIALMKFLSGVAEHHGVASHVYVVGGAVRNWLIGKPIKDIDVTIDSCRTQDGRDSAWFAARVQEAIPVRTSLTTNQYGVAILSVTESWLLGGIAKKGDMIEIANARKESYGGRDGKGYKPHLVEAATIEEDLLRREFTFNTLLFRLADLGDGPEKAPVLDLTGCGIADLKNLVLNTPQEPDRTFSDDPTRMLRAVSFASRFGFTFPDRITESIQRNASKLKQMPWDAVRKIVTDKILSGPAPQESLVMMDALGLSGVLKEMLIEEPGFSAALGRFLGTIGDEATPLLLDVMDRGWDVRVPLHFLDREGRTILRRAFQEKTGFGTRFVGALKKPPIDQTRLFTAYAIPAKERGIVVVTARQRLVVNPQLTDSPRDLESEVEAEIAARFPRTTV